MRAVGIVTCYFTDIPFVPLKYCYISPTHFTYDSRYPVALDYLRANFGKGIETIPVALLLNVVFLVV